MPNWQLLVIVVQMACVSQNLELHIQVLDDMPHIMLIAQLCFLAQSLVASLDEKTSLSEQKVQAVSAAGYLFCVNYWRP